MPAISVCLPVYNGEKFIAQALESIQAQTWPDFELLVVDNASSDGTRALVERYAASDSRIRYQRNSRNVGLVGNLNRCLALARGEWIKFMFHDDLMRPDCLEKFMAAAKDGDQIVCCNRGLILESGLSDELRNFYLGHAKILSETFAQGDFLPAADASRLILSRLGLNVFGEPIAMLFRREVVIEFGGFHADLPTESDIEFAARVVSNTGVRLIDEPLVSFRAHPGSTSSAATQSFNANLIQPILLLHEMVFGRAFAHLRETARSCTPPVDLTGALQDRIHIARNYAGDQSRFSKIESGEMTTMLNTALERLPGVNGQFWLRRHPASSLLREFAARCVMRITGGKR